MSDIAMKRAKQKQARRGLTRERLCELFDYDPETGIFRRRISISNRFRVGQVAGRPIARGGYRAIGIDYHHWLEHQLAWLYVYGEWPTKQIDHINGDRRDNRICNLREATPAQQRANSGPHKNNKSGVRGVHWNKQNNAWMAVIGYEGRRCYLGLFGCKEEAARAYQEAAKKLYGEYVREEAD